ncbi:MAG: hypothetical protein KJO07_18840 [Deltaproteobacteria bacterium]|nr:hypothetical protein [Deltaproteobacteria bacterium]
MRWQLLLLVLAMTVPGQTVHAEQPSVAIVLLGEVNLDRAESSRVGDRLGDALQAEFQARSIPATTMTAVASKVPQSCVSDLSCTKQLATRVRASYVLFVSVVRVGGSTRMESTWANPGRGFQLGQSVTLTGVPTNKGYRAAIRKLIPAGALRPRPVAQRRMTVGVWAFGGAALVLGASAGGFALWANARSDDCRGCTGDEFREIDNDVERRALAADILGAAALASGVTAVVLYLVSDSDDSGAESSALSVGPTQGGVGLSIGGRF